MSAAGASFRDLAERICAQPPRLGPVRLVAVDGPAGSGKTTFAASLGDALGADTAVVHLDDLYAGWHDLEGCWPRVQEWVLNPLACGRSGRMRRYDWGRGAFGAEWYDVPLRAVLILEGVGAARRAVAGRLTLSVWVEAPRGVRLARGVERDGQALYDELVRWQDEEAAHFAAPDGDLLGDPRVRPRPWPNKLGSSFDNLVS